MGYFGSWQGLRVGLGFTAWLVIACGGNAQGSATSPGAGGSSGVSGGQAAAGQPALPSSAGGGSSAAGAAGSLAEAAGAAGASAAGGPNAVACAGPLSFGDPDVELVVRHIAGVPARPLLASDVAAITDLSELFTLFGQTSACPVLDDCQRPDPPALDDWITSLAGLECLPNVQTASFDSWYVQDFTPLAALSKLQKLDLGLAPDLSSLPPLPQVTEFGVWHTSGGLSGLNSLPNLTSLNVSGGDLSAADALAPIAKMQNLKTLHLNRTRVTTVTALIGLKQLVDVDLGENDIADFSPLVQNVALGAGSTLSVYDNPITCDADVSIQVLKARGVVINCN